MEKDKNIILCGYMASGKSTVGKLLADKLELNHIDLDIEIEKRNGLLISEIFSEKGEIFFRKKESETLKEILKQKRSIISLGGGTTAYGVNLEIIKSDVNNTLIYLKTNIETLTKRLWKEKSERPLLNPIDSKENLEEYIRKHLFERNFYYLQSDLIIESSILSVEQIVDEIIEKLK